MAIMRSVDPGGLAMPCISISSELLAALSLPVSNSLIYKAWVAMECRLAALLLVNQQWDSHL